MSGHTIIEVKIHDKTDSAKCPETDEKKRMYC